MLNPNREALYENINQRVDEMIKIGFTEEQLGEEFKPKKIEIDRISWDKIEEELKETKNKENNSTYLTDEEIIKLNNGKKPKKIKIYETI